MFALVDCNNFFVSCERVFQPQLEGKAVVVLSNNDGCVVARSNESKAMGIKMCTPFYQVKHFVDEGRLHACSSNYALYGDLSDRVMSLLADAVPKIEIYSIDEAFLHLDGIQEGQIPQLCRDLVEKIRKWVGVPVSIGVAPTKTLAKIASHFAKKYKGYRGVCMMDTDGKRLKALSMTPIEDVWGIGRRLAPQMTSKGIQTALDFAQRPREWVEANFHVPGLRTWIELNGTVSLEEERAERRQSICTSRSFADMIDDEKELVLRVSDFAAMCARKLREEHSAACDVTVFLYTNRFRDDLKQYFPSATLRLEVAANSTQEIVGTALKAFRTIFRPGYKYKKAGVIVGSIVPDDCVQASLFDYDEELRKKQDRLSMVMDAVNSAAEGSGSSLIRLATQRPGHYADGIRSDFRSRLYSTSLDDIIEVH
ncbi:MAG: SOS mutagenesis and repair protein UmuC [Bacteroidales bacterium]|nr:SOS mutagenesis and repair protein UmuC [Bacteroidales bacterium]